MSIIRKELFNVLLNANHFNAENDTIEGSISPSEYATRLDILADVDRETVVNTLASLGYDIEGSFGEGGDILSNDDDSIIPNINTTFRFLDSDGNLVIDQQEVLNIIKSGEFDPSSDNVIWEYGYDLLGYVIKQLRSGTDGIIELKAGINTDVVFYNLSSATLIEDIFSNEIGVPGGFGGNLQSIRTRGEPFTVYGVQTSVGQQEFNTNSGYAQSTIGGNSTNTQTFNRIQRNQKYTIRVNNDTTIDYRAFQSRGNSGNLITPVVVNLRTRGNLIVDQSIEIFHDRSQYTAGIKTLTFDEWKSIGHPTINLVRYSWDSIKYYMQLTTDNTSPVGYIRAFIENDPTLLGEENTYGSTFYNRDTILSSTTMSNVDNIFESKRDLFRYYRKLVLTQNLNIPGTIGGGGPGGFNEPYAKKNYWDILNLGIALPLNYGGKPYAETVTAKDAWYQINVPKQNIDDTGQLVLDNNLTVDNDDKAKINRNTRLILAQPKYIIESLLLDDEYWSETDGLALSFNSFYDTNLSDDNFNIELTIDDEVLGGDGGTLNNVQLGINDYSEICTSVDYVFSRNNLKITSGKNIRYQPVITPGSEISVTSGTEINANFKKPDGIVVDNETYRSFYGPALPNGFDGITRTPHLIVYREMNVRARDNQYGGNSSEVNYQYDIFDSNPYFNGPNSTLKLDEARYGRLRRNSTVNFPPPIDGLVGYPLIDQARNPDYEILGAFQGIGPTTVFHPEAESMIRTGLYTGVTQGPYDTNKQFAGRFLVDDDIGSFTGYEDKDTALAVILFDYVTKYISQPGNIQIQYAGLTIQNALQGNRFTIPANNTAGLLSIQFPQSTAQSVDIPLTVNTINNDNSEEKIIRSSVAAKDFSQNLFGGSFNFKLTTTLDNENSTDKDSPFYNRIIPNKLNDLHSHAIDSSCLSFPYHSGHASTNGNPVKTLLTYRNKNNTDTKGQIYKLQPYTFYYNFYEFDIWRGFHPHYCNPLSQDTVAGGTRGNQDRKVDVNSFLENTEDYVKDEQKLIQRKFRIRNITSSPTYGSLAPTLDSHSPIDHRTTYAVMYNTDVVPVLGDTYTFSCKVRLSEGFKVTMGVRKYNVDPQGPELTLLEKYKETLGATRWFNPVVESGAKDWYSDETRLDYDSSTFNQLRIVVDQNGLGAIPNELTPLEFKMNQLLLDKMELAGSGNSLDEYNNFSFSGYDDIVNERIQDAFYVHTSATGSLPIDYDTVSVRSGKADPVYITYKHSNIVYSNKEGGLKAPIGYIYGDDDLVLNRPYRYQPGGAQICFFITFDTDWYKENISQSDVGFYDYVRSRRLEFEIIEPKFSGQDEYKEGPYINQPRIGPTIWTDTTAFNPNKGGYLPQESVYADYGLTYRLLIRNNPIDSMVINKTGYAGEISRGRDSVVTLGDYIYGLKNLINEGLTNTFDDNGEYLLQMVITDTYGNQYSNITPHTVDNIIKAVRSIDIVSTGSSELPYDVGYAPYNGLDVPFNTVVTSSEFYEQENDIDKRETLGVFSFDDEQSNLFEAVDNAPWIYNPLYSNAVFNTTINDNGEVIPDEASPKQDEYIDTSTDTIRLVPRWLPECDIRPFENLQRGSLNGTLFRYNDPTIEPDIVDITTAPTTVNFFFYRRREFVDFGPASTDPQKIIFDDSITESGFTTLWQGRSAVQGVNNIINPYGRKTTSRWTDQESGGETYWYFTASGSGGYFGPSGSNHMGFPDELDITEDDLPNWETFVSNIDWGDGTTSDRERLRNKPMKLSTELILSHTYTKPGVHKVTGCMWDMKKDTNEEGGVYSYIRNVRKFIARFHLNGNPNTETNLLLNNVPTVMVSGVSEFSIYNKSLETFIGYVPPTNTQEQTFLPYPFKYHYDKVSSAAAAASVDEKYINPDLLTPYAEEKYLIRTVTNDSASYSGRKIMSGLFRNFGSLGDYLGDTDIAQTRIFTQPYRIAQHLGFPNNNVTLQEASTPDNKKYWNNIIPKDYLFTNREGIDSTIVGGKTLLTIDTSSGQQWENNFMYPALPLLNQFGKFDESLGLPSGSVLYGQKTTWEGSDNISYITKEIINDTQLRLDAQLHTLDDNSILDTAGEGIIIRPISDYKIGVDLRTNEIEFNEPLYGLVTDSDEKAY